MKVLKFTLFLAVIMVGAINFAFTAEGGYQVGDKVQDFSLKNTDGNMYSLANLADQKGAIIVFTCNHCPYAKLYEQRIMDLNTKYAPLGYPVIAINPNDPGQEPEDSFEEMVKRSHQKAYKFPYLFDAAQDVYPVFGATRTPHSFVISKKGDDFFVEYIGAIDNNTKDGKKADSKYVQEAVDALLKGEKPATTFTKAVGCGIKAKK